MKHTLDYDVKPDGTCVLILAPEQVATLDAVLDEVDPANVKAWRGAVDAALVTAVSQVFTEALNAASRDFEDAPEEPA